MSDMAITAPVTVLKTAPNAVRTWLTQALGLGTSVEAGQQEQEQDAHAQEWGLARLSNAEAHEVVEGIHDRTREVLRAIAELQPRFRWADLAKKVGCPLDDDAPLRGVFRGLTKRTRTVTGDRKAGLIVWPNWDDLSWEDAIGEMHPDTHAAFRRVFSIT